MNSQFYREHEVFIDSARNFLRQEVTPHVAGWEKNGRFPDEIFRTFGSQGYLGILISPEYGGIGGDYKLASCWCELFGEVPSVGFTTGLNMHSLVICHALDRYGSKAAKQLWLPRAMTGEAIGAYAFTEPGAGSDLARATTRAEKVGTKWKITGAKTFITNGARADFVLVLTRTDMTAGSRGYTTFLVDTSLPGFSVVSTFDKLGWRASDTATLAFDGVEVEESCILGNLGEGWHQAATNLNWERLMLTLTSLGGARACLRDTERYVADRSAFGRQLSSIGVLQDLLDEMHFRLRRGEALTHHAATLLQKQVPCRAEVSAAKRLVCEDAVWIADRCIQLHGGYGYTTEFSPERWWRDLRLMTIGGGTSEIMGNILTKELGLLL